MKRLVDAAVDAVHTRGHPLGDQEPEEWESFTQFIYGTETESTDLVCFAALSIEAVCWAPRAASLLTEHVWAVMNHAPSDLYDLDDWIDIWATIGWQNATDGQGRPDAPIKLYRGAHDDHARGMCWSPDQEVAGRFPLSCPGHAVFETKASPADVLARFSTDSEDEYVLDPRALSIEPVLRRPPHTCGPDHQAAG